MGSRASAIVDRHPRLSDGKLPTLCGPEPGLSRHRPICACVNALKGGETDAGCAGGVGRCPSAGVPWVRGLAEEVIPAVGVPPPPPPPPHHALRNECMDAYTTPCEAGLFFFVRISASMPLVRP